jgi:hypothetical protein
VLADSAERAVESLRGQLVALAPQDRASLAGLDRALVAVLALSSVEATYDVPSILALERLLRAVSETMRRLAEIEDHSPWLQILRHKCVLCLDLISESLCVGDSADGRTSG